MRKWLKGIREESRLTMEEMATRLGLDVDYYEIIEMGKLSANIPVLVAAKIAEDFDISLSRLILYEEEYRNGMLSKKHS